MGEQNVYDAQKHICFNIGRVMRRVYDHYEQRLIPYNLTTPQYFVFNALWMGDGISINKLGERVFFGQLNTHRYYRSDGKKWLC